MQTTTEPEKKIDWDWNLLPEVLRDYGINMARINMLSDKMIWTSILATACASLGRNAFVTPNSKNPTWKERCNLWGLCTAPAGSRKSESLKRAIKPIQIEQKKLHEEWAEEMDEWLKEETDFKPKKSWYTKQLQTLMASGGDTSEMVAPSLRPKPKKKHYIATDITAERIPSFIAEAQGSAFVAIDEMSAFFQSTGSKSSRNTGAEARAIYMAAWSGDSFDSILRQDKEKETNSEGASISIFGMVQPDIIADHVSDYKKSKDGFFPRFQLVTYETQYQIHEENETPYNEIASDKYGAFISKLINFKRENAFYFEGEAVQKFKNWHKNNEFLLKKYNDRKDFLMAEVIAKRTKVVCALALVIHLAEQFEVTTEPTGGIQPDALQRAIDLNEFYISQIKQVIGSEQQREVEDEEVADRILDWLADPLNKAKLRAGVTASSIADALRKKGTRPAAELIKRVAMSAKFGIKGGRIHS
jgi:hypothetical protein